MPAGILRMLSPSPQSGPSYQDHERRRRMRVTLRTADQDAEADRE
jgi:hypothetical protein